MKFVAHNDGVSGDGSAMDVVNGKIVETGEGRAGIRLAGVEPSPGHPNHVPGWASMPWAATDSGGALERVPHEADHHHHRRQPGWKWSSSNWGMEVGNSSSSGTMMVEPARAQGLKPSRALGLQPSRARVLLPGSSSFVREWDHGSTSLPADRWKRGCSDTSTRGLTAPTWDISSDQLQPQRHYHFDCSPCSGDKLDEEMTRFESQLSRSVSGDFSSFASINPAQPEFSSPDTCSPGHKRKRSGLSDGDLQVECGWTQPLKPLIRKGLTISDVGELGRIILPKKDAESQSFPHVDTKEGTVLEMQDYTASKRWYFRFKYWTNNKSRMYVLENTGGFIKYHGLKEHDIFTVYEDGCKKLVVSGLKMKSGDNADPVLSELSKGSTLETVPTSSDDELKSLTDSYLQ